MRVAGIDLSPNATAIVVGPDDWGLDWSRLDFATFPCTRGKVEDIDRPERLRAIARWLHTQLERFKPEHAFIEGYPKSGRVHHLDKVAEVGGVIRAVLGGVRIPAQTAEISTARKLIMGTLPRADVKEIVHQSVRSLGVPFETGDEIDAWVAFNWGLGELGHVCVTPGEG